MPFSDSFDSFEQFNDGYWLTIDASSELGCYEFEGTTSKG